MKFIYNNPFRVLGISVNATTREKDRNVARAKAFLAGKKQVRFDSDIPLPVEAERTLESIQEASSQIQQIKGRLRHAHLWFWEGNPVDSKAFQLIKNDSPDKGVELLLRNSLDKEVSARNYSSFRNLAVYYMSMLRPGIQFNEEIAEAGLRFLGQFFKSDYFDEYSREVVGDEYLDRQATIDDLCNVVFKPFKQWIQMGEFDASEFTGWIKEFPEEIQKKVKGSFIAKPLNDINQEINKAKEQLDKDGKYGYFAGKKLFENAGPILKQLEGLLTRKDYRYEAAAADLAKQIRSCCFAYWEAETESGESDPGPRCLYLTEKAYELCPFGSTGDQLKGDRKQIKEWIAGADERKQQEKIKGDIEFLVRIVKKLESLSGPSQLSQAKSILNESKPRLNRVRDVLGEDDDLYIKISTGVASHIMACLIDYANTYALDRADHAKVERIMVRLGDLDMDYTFSLHWQKNLNVIQQNLSATSSEGGKGCLVIIVVAVVIWIIGQL